MTTTLFPTIAPHVRRIMRALTLLGTLAVAGVLSGTHAAVASPLITPTELKAAIERKSVRVLDIRELVQGDGKTPNYAAGHIPGAVAAPYSSIRGPESNPGQVPSDAVLTSLFRKWGITPSTHVVIAHTGADASDFGGAARFYWTLKLAGIARISILDGGFGAWGALKYPIDTSTPTVTPSDIRVTLDRRQIATTAGVADLMKSRSSGGKTIHLSDNRPEDYFTGADKHPSAARAGTLPGAKHFDHEEWFQLNTGKLLTTPELERLAKGAGLLTADPVITFCNTGHWSATTWFVLSEMLQQPNVRMYPESVVGWSQSRNPMDNEPSRAKFLVDQLKEAVGNLKK